MEELEEMKEMTKELGRNQLLNAIYDYTTKIEQKQKEVEEINNAIASMQGVVEEYKLKLLNLMKDAKVQEYQGTNNLFANLFSKNEFSYGDEKALLNKLQEMRLSQYIKTVTKTTISIDKSALKKDLKVNASLKEDLKDFVGDKVVEYVTVTNAENHQKMLEHIEENTKK